MAQSSAEAELGGMVKGSAELIGMAAVFRDLGLDLKERAFLYADASAALGVVQRKGAGAIRHLETRLLWVQEQEIKKKIEYLKIAGTINPADLGTKHLDGESMKRHLKSWGLSFESGRPEVAPGQTKWGPKPEEKEVACATHNKSSEQTKGVAVSF